jgi:hypothetical protein
LFVFVLVFVGGGVLVLPPQRVKKEIATTIKATTRRADERGPHDMTSTQMLAQGAGLPLVRR